MRPLFSTTDWPPIAVYDLEAEHWVNVVMACHIDELGNRLTFPDVKKYLDWLFTDFKGDIVFAHFGGHYDHRFLIAEAKERGWDFRTAISGGTIVILTIDNGKRSIKFGDSYRLMPDSLKKIGDTVGLPKLEVDPSKIHLMSDQETLDYCFRDCEIVLKGLQLMREKLTGAGADFAFTLASIAARYNRRNPAIDWDKFVVRDGKRWVPHPNVKLWDKECYHAYFGGRCEMFMQGTFKGPIYWYDIVSSYPTSMREDLPLYYLGFFTPPKNLVDVEKYLSHCGITQCSVYVPETEHIAVLPVKDPNGRLTFPVGPLSGSWTNIELVEAIKHGAVITELVGQWRFEAAPFMRKFIDTFYALRQDAKNKADEFSSYAYKIFLNSSYGKFVETIDRKSYLTNKERMRALYEIEARLKRGEPGGKIETTPTQGVFCLSMEEIGPFRHTAAGAYITAYSRLRLFRMAKEMYDKGATIYYCDTDSLMLDMQIEKTGKGLGDWEYVDTLSELEIVLPKVYRAVGSKKTVYKCKGCPIERKWETPDMPLKRWEAFKNFRFDETEEAARVLGKDGITGFVSDIKFGSLRPRRLEKSCKACSKTGRVKGLECPACGGRGMTANPLVRALRSGDLKRRWDGPTSKPIAYPLPPKIKRHKVAS